MEVGTDVEVVKTEPLGNNTVAPPLQMGQKMKIVAIIEDSAGNPHFDVGIESKVNFVRSIETKEQLPNGDKIHWCHPSRFVVAKKEEPKEKKEEPKEGS